MLPLNVSKFILETPDYLLRRIILRSLIQSVLKLLIFSFEHLKDGLFILELVLQSLSNIFKLLNVLLHLDKDCFLLLFLFFFHRLFLVFLLCHILLEIVQ